MFLNSSDVWLVQLLPACVKEMFRYHSYVTQSLFFFSFSLSLSFSFFYRKKQQDSQWTLTVLNIPHKLIDYCTTYLLRKRGKSAHYWSQVPPLQLFCYYMIVFSFLVWQSYWKLPEHNQSFSLTQRCPSCSATFPKYRGPAVLQQSYTRVTLGQLGIWFQTFAIDSDLVRSMCQPACLAIEVASFSDSKTCVAERQKVGTPCLRDPKEGDTPGERTAWTEGA